MKKILLLQCCFFLLNSINAQTPDLSFGTNGLAAIPTPEVDLSMTDKSSALTPDGHIITVGSFYSGSSFDMAVFKINADGTPDNSFGTSGRILVNPIGHDEVPRAVIVQPDGKILIAGYSMNYVWGEFRYDIYGLVIRLNSDGSYDNSFDGDGIVALTFGDISAGKFIQTVALQPDNKIIIGGDYDLNFLVARLNPNGSFDATFNGSGYNIFNAGELSSSINACYIQQDGKIDLAGSSIVRLNSNGILDNSFDGDGIRPMPFSHCSSVTAQPDGKMILAGYSPNTNAYMDFAVIRLNTDGSYDNSFNGTGFKFIDFSTNQDEANTVLVKPDGKILLSGYAYFPRAPISQEYFAFAQLNSDGSPDNSFGTGGKYYIGFDNVYDKIYSAFLLPGNKLLGCGLSGGRGDNTSRIGMVRLHLSPVNIYYRDADEDGFGAADDSTQAPSQPDGYVTDKTDCDDTKLTYADNDGDGYGTGNKLPCGVANNSDCNDNDSTVHSEQFYYEDRDRDGFGSPRSIVAICSSTPIAGYVVNKLDCNDQDAAINPNTIWAIDNDNDGHAPELYKQCESPGPGWFIRVNQSIGDCDDNNASIYLGAPELCDGIDNNCNDVIDEGTKTLYYRDADSDGFGDYSNSLYACSQPEGYITYGNDCDDSRPGVHPGAAEICGNGLDDNCNGSIDEGGNNTYYRDFDGDGFGNAAQTTQACAQPFGYVSNSTDCNDNDATVHAPVQYFVDADGDGFGSTTTAMLCSATAPAGYATNNSDCKDGDATSYPGATEICDGFDNNCNGQADEGLRSIFYRDLDGDGYGNPAAVTQACSMPLGYVDNNTDCNDSNATVNPAAMEVCGNNIDENCNGQLNENCPTNSLPRIYVTNTFSVEGDNGTKNVTFIFVLSKKTGVPVTVRYQTANKTATAGQDYAQKSGTVTFPANSQFQTVVVSAIGDLLDEPDETFTLVVSNPVNATLFNTSATCVIRDNDPLPALRIFDVTTNEYSKKALVRVDLSTPSGKIVKVKYDTRDGSAKAPSDYSAVTNGSLTFQPGETTKYINIVVKQDASNEPPEKFYVKLKQPENGTLLPDVEADITILNSTQTAANEVITKTGAISVQEQNNDFVVKVSPNPSVSTFRFTIESSSQERVHIRVTDILGRPVEIRNGIQANSNVQMGSLWRAGSYLAEFIQGKQRKTVQLVKLN